RMTAWSLPSAASGVWVAAGSVGAGALSPADALSPPHPASDRDRDNAAATSRAVNRFSFTSHFSFYQFCRVHSFQLRCSQETTTRLYQFPFPKASEIGIMMVYWILTFQRGQPAPDAIFEDGLPMLNIQTYVRAKSLEEAYTLNQKRNARVLGGMLWLKMASNTVGTAIDLCELGLDTIEEDETGFTLGAMATLRMLEQHPGLAAY